MALTNEQRALLRSEAERRGLDADDLIAAADSESPDAEGPGQKSVPTDEPGNLFMYLLPFVTVGEVRKIWLKVPGALSGASDDTNAAEWAARFAAGAPKPAPDEP